MREVSEVLLVFMIIQGYKVFDKNIVWSEFQGDLLQMGGEKQVEIWRGRLFNFLNGNWLAAPIEIIL